MELKNFSPSCERNKDAILAQLTRVLAAQEKLSSVLEIGSLSGQHAIHFSRHLPHILWQSTDLEECISALVDNLSLYAPGNCLPAKELNVAQAEQWPNETFDHVFTANTLHIMSWQHVIDLFKNIPQVSHQGTQLIIYGPFKYKGQFTSKSNEEFELWLKDRDRNSGIRDFEAINSLAEKAHFSLKADIAMPANNQLLVWKRLAQ